MENFWDFKVWGGILVFTVVLGSLLLANVVKKGLPFRSAYKICGQIVGDCIKNGKVLETLELNEYKNYSELFDADLYNEISLKTCVEKRISEGGTSPKSVEKQIEFVKGKINV